MMRLFNRLLVFACGVALAAVGFIVATEAVWTGLGYRFLWFPGQRWLHALRATAWSDRSAMVGGAVVAAIGLVLLVAEVRPWPRRLAHSSIQGQDTWLIQRHSAEQYLQRTIQQNVSDSPIRADLHISDRRWRLRLRVRSAPSTEPRLVEAGHHGLEGLGAPTGSKVIVRIPRAPRAT
jgi:hypothetical protein